MDIVKNLEIDSTLDCVGITTDSLSLVFGTTAGTICEGNDPRITSTKTLVEHANSHVDGTDDIQLATTSQNGLMSSVNAFKLETCETGANITNTSTVTSAGTFMKNETSAAGCGFFLNENDMASNSSTKICSQSSVKAYIDSKISSGLGFDWSVDHNNGELNYDFYSPEGICFMYWIADANTYGYCTIDLSNNNFTTITKYGTFTGTLNYTSQYINGTNKIALNRVMYGNHIRVLYYYQTGQINWFMLR